jgi:hypothetical protein
VLKFFLVQESPPVPFPFGLSQLLLEHVSKFARLEVTSAGQSLSFYVINYQRAFAFPSLLFVSGTFLLALVLIVLFLSFSTCVIYQLLLILLVFRFLILMLLLSRLGFFRPLLVRGGFFLPFLF